MAMLDSYAVRSIVKGKKPCRWTVFCLPTTREGMTEETVAAYNARSLDTGWSADWFLEGNMAIAKIEPPPQFDLGTKLTQWRQRHAEGKAIRRAIPRESHAGWTPGKDRPDPMKLMAQSNQGRQEHLVPLRMGRMAASPFAFLRGQRA
jgi:hypothetical protein